MWGYNMCSSRTLILLAVPPIQPTNVAAVNINRTSVDITWLVPRLTYGTETYMVLYGMSEDVLNQQSAIVFSGRDSSVENSYYSVTLENLQSYTLYYYKVVATNILTSTNSDIYTFTTCKEYIFLHICVKTQHFLPLQ